MIRNIRHRGLRRLYEQKDASRLNPEHVSRLRSILTLLDAAVRAEDLNYPGSDFHPLRGNRKGFHAVRVSGNWRVIFRFVDGDVFDVDYVDYH